jgi:hypothetical protein
VLNVMKLRVAASADEEAVQSSDAAVSDTACAAEAALGTIRDARALTGVWNR